MKRIVILGSTGSVGRSALDVIARHPDRFRVAGLAARGSVDLLERQARTFSPDVVGVADPRAAVELRKRLGKKPEIYPGEEGILAVASYNDADFVLSAMVGFSGLVPTIRALQSGKTIGLANKEVLVTAGELVMKQSSLSRAPILPVDSEHSAIFQCIDGQDARYLKRIILTASGGPFVGKKAADLKNVGPEEALKHPNWKMGKKITIDSATLMNKGLEVIEAHHLFGLPAERIDVLIHPQSIVHSLIEFSDGSMLAQMSLPDMRGPIAHCLAYPERLEGVLPPLELDLLGTLSFHKPDTESFPCLSYAFDALRSGGTMPAVMNASNEIAVSSFLEKKILFGDIPAIISETMQSHEPVPATELEAIIEADRWAREKAKEYIGKCRS